MKCTTRSRGFGEAVEGIRREFEHGLGLPTHRPFAGLSTKQDGGNFLLTIDLPGLKREEISITLENCVLEISGERQRNFPEGSVELHNDRHFGAFRKTLKLHETIDPESIDAVLENGVLSIRLSRRPELQARKVEIRAAD